MAPPRIILADDHTLVVEALRKLLETRCNIVGTVSDGMALVEAASSLKPDVIVADIVMPLLSGLEAGRQIKTLMPTVKLIFMTMNEDPDLALEAMRERASGYLLKSSAASELFQAVQVALKGGSYVTPRIVKGMQEAFIRDPEAKQIHERGGGDS
jgi:DNA-binding NarL/FixJ family response regulator